jgi:hypothetical protein
MTHCDAMVVELRAAGTSHHLQHVRDGEIHVAARGCVIELRALYHHQVSREVDAPRQRRRAHLRRHFVLFSSIQCTVQSEGAARLHTAESYATE